MYSKRVGCVTLTIALMFVSFGVAEAMDAPTANRKCAAGGFNIVSFIVSFLNMIISPF